ncbi:uncharacterized protein LOC132902805 [Amyelois transitella]|uniref:uncharacterized protein LOC132902805 n=1 Tax=Amyelois transitella TaxID=680683 RepID=UPI00298F7EC8|nr:uncharacterized protein LOC132902805 [Amyelois transitella]
MFAKLLLVSFVCVSVVCEYRNSGKRRARLFTFNTLDHDIVVSMEFSIPFLTIPVKKTMDDGLGLSSLGLPPVNINPGALALGGAIVLGTTIIIPLILKKFAYQYPEQRYSKLLNTAGFEADVLLEFVNEVVENKSFQSCALRIACWSGQSGQYVEFIKMWDQITSNKIISSMINATAVEDAMVQGRKGLDCLTYTPCPLRRNHLQEIMKNIAFFMKSHDLF